MVGAGDFRFVHHAQNVLPESIVGGIGSAAIGKDSANNRRTKLHEKKGNIVRLDKFIIYGIFPTFSI